MCRIISYLDWISYEIFFAPDVFSLQADILLNVDGLVKRAWKVHDFC